MASSTGHTDPASERLAAGSRSGALRPPVAAVIFDYGGVLRGDGRERWTAVDAAAGLPAGTVVNLVFAVNLGDTIRLHRRKAVLAHVSERGAGLMMQGRSQLRPSA